MIRIGGSEIESGQSPFIVAEIGSNWKTFEDKYNAIETAKNVGADAVKFQMLDHKSLYGHGKTKKSSYDDSYDLPFDSLAKLKTRADQVGINFMVTCFNPEHVRGVDQYVYAHKIASSDINHLKLLEEVNKMGKPVILSTGASTIVEIQTALSYLPSVPVILMYCVSAYPAKQIDLTLIDELRNYCKYVGFSDHTTDPVYIPYAAYKFHQACVIEKHMTTITDSTPDSPHSITPANFKLMADTIRGKRKSLIGPTAEEKDMLQRHNRRLVTTEEIKKGEMLRFDKNFGCYRSLSLDSKGLPAFLMNEVNNRKSTRDMDIGDTIGKGDYE